MSDIRLSDTTGDIEIEDFELKLTEDFADSVKQRLRMRLRTFLGEYFLDLTFGVPYYQQIFVKGISKGVVDSIFKKQIKETPGVLRLLEYTSDLDRSTRRYSADFKAKLEDETVIEDII